MTILVTWSATAGIGLLLTIIHGGQLRFCGIQIRFSLSNLAAELACDFINYFIGN